MEITGTDSPNVELVIKDIHKSFKDKKVLCGCTATLKRGTIYGLLGRNGAGKTTLLSILAGNLAADSGEFYLQQNGQPPRLVTDEDIFLMVAEPKFPNFLTGEEFIQFFYDINKSHIAAPQSIDAYFEAVDFAAEDRCRLIQGYSTGMKNKLQMIMFLILRPLIILMDEPLTSLDILVQLQIKKLIRQIQSEHIIILSTHILQLAEDLCDSIVFLKEGQIQAQGLPASTAGLEDMIMSTLKDEGCE